jgi:hypothetical protein
MDKAKQCNTRLSLKQKKESLYGMGSGVLRTVIDTKRKIYG